MLHHKSQHLATCLAERSGPLSRGGAIGITFPATQPAQGTSWLRAFGSPECKGNAGAALRVWAVNQSLPAAAAITPAAFKSRTNAGLGGRLSSATL